MSYLKFLYENAKGGYISVVSLPNGAPRFFKHTDIERAESYMIEHSMNANLYHGWALLRGVPTSGRGKGSDAYATPGIFLDIDLLSPDINVHSASKLPGDQDSAQDVLREAGFPEPTAVRNSGNGRYFDWIYDDLWVFNDESERQVAGRLASRFNVLAIAAFKERGWVMDNMSDLARITRTPGTLNHKTTPAKAVELIACDSANRFSSVKLNEIISNLEQKSGRTFVGSRNATSNNEHDNKYNRGVRSSADATAHFDSIAAGCRWVASTIDNAEALPEPHWHAIAGIAACCVDGRSIFHKLSAKDNRYDEAESDKKFDRADTEAGPRTCHGIATGLGYAGCQQCPFFAQKTMKSPVALGSRTAAEARLMSQNAYDVSTARYVNLATKRFLDEKAFAAKYKHEFPKSSPHQALLNDNLTMKVDRVDYLPGNRLLFAQDDDQTLINTWSPSDLDPVEGPCETILDHLTYLIPEAADRDHLLDMFASSVQAPQKKIRHVALLIGGQGTGKSFLGQILSKIHGHKNVYIAEASDISDGWTESLGNKSVLVMEEMNFLEKREMYESLKRWITEEIVTVNEKYVKKHFARTPTLIVSFSNHDAPIALSKDDRRFMVIKSPAIPRNKEYYENLFRAGNTEVAAFYYHLLSRDISKFSADAPPPMTTAKQEVINRSEPILVQEIRMMLEANDAPFNFDLFEMNRLRDHLQARVGSKYISTPEVQRSVMALGARPLERQIRLDGSTRARLWICRNFSRWETAANEDIKASYHAHDSFSLR